MSAAVERFFAPSFSTEVKAQPDISVVFTSVDGTLVALKQAGAVGSRTGARITLVVPQVVPHPGQVPSRSLVLDDCDWRFSVITDHMPVETRIHLFPCLDRLSKLISVLNPRSLVIIGGRRRWWWATAEERLAKGLRQAGYEVTFVEQ